MQTCTSAQVTVHRYRCLASMPTSLACCRTLAPAVLHPGAHLPCARCCAGPPVAHAVLELSRRQPPGTVVVAGSCYDLLEGIRGACTRQIPGRQCASDTHTCMPLGVHACSSCRHRRWWWWRGCCCCSSGIPPPGRSRSPAGAPATPEQLLPASAHREIGSARPLSRTARWGRLAPRGVPPSLRCLAQCLQGAMRIRAR